MEHFICRHWRLAKPMERRNFVLLTAPDNSERILSCEECYDEPGAHQRCEHVSEFYFKALLEVVRKMDARNRQREPQAAN